ncbi:MAG: Xaa-Pro dipeptidase [Gammaproteobacteria bacterium]|nr:Xaa-Pro dipeptidase [Gammaproteobacteria bacterium]
MSALLVRKSAVYYPFLQTGGFEKILFHTWKKARTFKRGHAAMDSSFCDLSPYLARMRLYKSPEEYQCLQQAVDVSVKAHLAVMENIGKLSYEYEAVAIFHQSLQSQGLMETAYPSIVASGPNACVLHYTQSNRKFLPNDLLLIDAGAEYLGYAADITRTYPINGQWQGPAEAIYNLVLEAQLKAIEEVKAKNPWSKMQETVIRTLTQGLMDLGILTGSLDGLIEQKAYMSFYMHNSGHWLGLDVHDCGRYKINGKWRALEPGMVLTVEPGLYLSMGLANVDSRWWGIGVRIEDDILVTEKGHKNLSGALASEIDDIEALIRG